MFVVLTTLLVGSLSITPILQRKISTKPELLLPNAIPARLFDQPIDHSDLSKGTFSQRYWVDTQYFTGKGPVFICVGGEGPAMTDNVLVSSVHCNDMVELAPKLGALTLALEHRFYGDSQPFNGSFAIEHLQFLSSRIALEDLANFHDWIIDEFSLTDANRWVSWGGSYPGMLSGWFRSNYPDKVYASVSSSSPVQAQLDMPEYNNIVGDSMAAKDVGGSKKCKEIIRDGHEQIGKMLTEGKLDILSKQFNICGGEQALNPAANQAYWAGQGVVYLPIQENDPGCNDTVCNIELICNFLEDTTIPVGSDVPANVEKLASLAALQFGSDCNTVSYEAFIDALQNESNSDRAWFYQTCNEFGFYQTCESGSGCIFTQGLLNTYIAGLDMCNRVFQINETKVKTNIANTLDYYGGDHINSTRIGFPNGQIDPWHGLGVLKSVDEKLEPTIWVKGASHHFWTHPENTIVQKTVREAKHEIWKIVSKWLSE